MRSGRMLFKERKVRRADSGLSNRSSAVNGEEHGVDVILKAVECRDVRKSSVESSNPCEATKSRSCGSRS